VLHVLANVVHEQKRKGRRRRREKVRIKEEEEERLECDEEGSAAICIKPVIARLTISNRTKESEIRRTDCLLVL
jgi:hypothetical protein